jgi:molybdopterin synthase sulfur carrier subunit
MSVQVRIPTVLRPRVAGQPVVAASGATVAEVLASIETAHPGFASVVLEADGSLKHFVNVFLDDEDVRYLQGMATPVPDGATLIILPAVAGG